MTETDAQGKQTSLSLLDEAIDSMLSEGVPPSIILVRVTGRFAVTCEVAAERVAAASLARRFPAARSMPNQNDRAAYFRHAFSPAFQSGRNWVAIRGCDPWVFSGTRPVFRKVDDFGSVTFFEARHL